MIGVNILALNPRGLAFVSLPAMLERGRWALLATSALGVPGFFRAHRMSVPSYAEPRHYSSRVRSPTGLIEEHARQAGVRVTACVVPAGPNRVPPVPPGLHPANFMA
jgi:hypothetical protein